MSFYCVLLLSKFDLFRDSFLFLKKLFYDVLLWTPPAVYRRGGRPNTGFGVQTRLAQRSTVRTKYWCIETEAEANDSFEKFTHTDFKNHENLWNTSNTTHCNDNLWKPYCLGVGSCLLTVALRWLAGWPIRSGPKNTNNKSRATANHKNTINHPINAISNNKMQFINR